MEDVHTALSVVAAGAASLLLPDYFLMTLRFDSTPQSERAHSDSTDPYPVPCWISWAN